MQSGNRNSLKRTWLMFSNYCSTGESRTQHAARKGLNKRWWTDVGRATAMPNIRDTPWKRWLTQWQCGERGPLSPPSGTKGRGTLFMRAYVHRTCYETHSCIMQKANSVARVSWCAGNSSVRDNFHDFPRVRARNRFRNETSGARQVKIAGKRLGRVTKRETPLAYSSSNLSQINVKL